jgi:hypothetical protein
MLGRRFGGRRAPLKTRRPDKPTGRIFSSSGRRDVFRGPMVAIAASHQQKKETLRRNPFSSGPVFDRDVAGVADPGYNN